MRHHIENLRNAYAITLGDQLLPGAGVYGVGAVASVMPDEASGHAFIEEFEEDIAPLGRGPAALIQVGEPWQFMRRAAGEGLAGIEGANTDAFPHRFMFMVRVEEAGAELPTVLASITESGWDVCITRTGVKDFEHTEVLHWQRFDILDQVIGKWGQRCPFRSSNQGDPLYELCSDDIVVLIAHVPLLGDWNSTEGAFAFFTSEEEADHYHHHHLGDGRNRMVFVGPNAPDDAHKAMASLGPRPVEDLGARLLELAEVNPQAAWCVNPDSHRENAAYGRLMFGNDHPAGLGRDPNVESPRMVAVSGIWNVRPGNVFEIASAMAPWSGWDTIRWSGSQSLQLLPLDRSFLLDLGPHGLDLDDITESEAEEVVAGWIGGIQLEASWEELGDTDTRVDERLNQFHTVCWDVVTGNGADLPWRFPDFLSALRHFAAFEREHDRLHRAEGAVSCMHIGFSGSGDPAFEDLRSARFQLGLRRIGLRVLQRGYQPSDAADLAALCNGTLRTLHVEFAGFAKDLLWASAREQEEALLAGLDIDDETWAAWSSSVDAKVDPAGKQLVVARIGGHVWERLLPKARHFLATALLQLDKQGHAPQLDYAPISIEVVKALEVELGRLLVGFRDAVSGKTFQHEAESHEKSLADFLTGKKPPALGNMSYLLRRPNDHASELHRALHEYLSHLPNCEFLTSRKFVRGLQKVINKYRNNGAHDSAIPENVCRECIDVLIGDQANPGYIAQVVAQASTAA